MSGEFRLHYIESGSGAPLILLHGNGEDHTYFERQIPHFAANRHVFAPDTRGHGQSPRGEAPFTIRQFAEDLHGFMQEHGLEKADLLGFSDGGNISLCFALRYPECVNRLILCGANLNARGVRASVQLPIELGYRIASLFAAKNPQARRKAELLGLMVNDPEIPPEELARITAPTLVIAGTHDMIKAEHTRLIAQLLPHSQLVFLPGSHFVARENPEVFNRTAESFLREE